MQPYLKVWRWVCMFTRGILLAFLIINQYTQKKNKSCEELKTMQFQCRWLLLSLPLDLNFFSVLFYLSLILISSFCLPSLHFIHFHSFTPCAPHHPVSVFPPTFLSQSAICWRKWKTAALSNHNWWRWASFIWHSDDVRPGQHGLMITKTWPYLKGQEVQCLHQPAWSVLISFGKDTWKCQSLCSVQ